MIRMRGKSVRSICLWRTLGVVLAATISTSYALDPPPGKRGWSGYILLGVGGGSLRSNTIAGNSFKEIGDAEIDSLTEEAGLEREFVPVLTGEITYYWDETGTQIILGNILEDLVRYDFTTRLGLRQSLGDAGTLGVDLLGSTTPSRVYKDPFITGQRRDTTDRSSTGGRLTWDRIGGSGLEIELTGRRIELDEEESGEFLALASSDRELLSREGDLRQARVSYVFRMGGKYAIVPRITSTRYDLDGDAASNDRTYVDVGWSYRRPGAVLTVDVGAGKAEYDEMHPVYGEKRDEDIVGISVTGFFPKVFPSEEWILVVNAGGADVESNIDFYNTRVALVSVSAMWKF